MKNTDAHMRRGKADGTASRAPLIPERITDLLQQSGVQNVRVEHVVTTGSTNADLAARVGTGALADRTVLLAEEQVAGKGRLDRPWSAPRGSQLICSMAIIPAGDSANTGDSVDHPAGSLVDRLGELPLLVGVAAAQAIRELGISALLKWPNDLQVIRDGEPFKLAGILVEAVSVNPLHIVVGVGLNVSMTQTEFDSAGLKSATSLMREGLALPDLQAREGVTVALLRHLLTVDDAWREGGEAVQRYRDRYREFSSTLGTPVRAELPGGKNLYGQAVDLGPHGELIIETAPESDGTATRHLVTAGDVVHLRPDERGV